MDTTSFKKSILDALTKYVDNYVDEKLESFMKKIIEKHPEIEEDELVGMWNKNMKLEDEKKPEKPKAEQPKAEQPKAVQPKAVQPKAVKKSEEPKSVTSGCPYKFTRGDKAGKVCGVKSKNGDLYCSTHKKSAPAETVKPPQRRQSEASVAPSVASSIADEYKTLKMHKKLEKPWNKATGFVFKSATERVVIGKLGEKDTIEKLTDDDVEMCKKFHFKIAEEIKQVDSMQKTINKSLGISEDEEDDEDEQDD